MFLKPARTPGNPPNRPEMGAPGRPDIVGLSSEIVGFRNLGGGPVGHPQGVQLKTLILIIKCFTNGHHVDGAKRGVNSGFGRGSGTKSGGIMYPIYLSCLNPQASGRL